MIFLFLKEFYIEGNDEREKSISSSFSFFFHPAVPIHADHHHPPHHHQGESRRLLSPSIRAHVNQREQSWNLQSVFSSCLSTYTHVYTHTLKEGRKLKFIIQHEDEREREREAGLLLGLVYPVYSLLSFSSFSLLISDHIRESRTPCFFFFFPSALAHERWLHGASLWGADLI